MAFRLADANSQLQKLREEWQHSDREKDAEIAALKLQIPRWIPVSERLPAFTGRGIWSEPVLTVVDWSKFGGIKEQRVQRYVKAGDKEEWEEYGSDATVTHWQPRPEFPEAE